MEERSAIIAIVLVFIIVIAGIFFWQNAIDMTKPRSFPSQTPEYCESKGATYKGFTNGCMDSCEYARNPGACTTVLTSGCDCGPEKCWNGFECENN
jgi:hypothetical protein